MEGLSNFGITLESGGGMVAYQNLLIIEHLDAEPILVFEDLHHAVFAVELEFELI